MPVTIDFRGVMLFQCTRADGGLLEQILLPNADATSGWPRNGKHPDNSDARLHYAGLLVKRQGGNPPHKLLKGLTVEIVVDAANDAPTVSLPGLPRLSQVPTNGETVDSALAAVQIAVKGDRLFEHPVLDPNQFTERTFLNDSVDSHGARLEGNSATILIKQNGQIIDRIDLSSDDRAIVYNYENAHPSTHDLDHVGQCEQDMYKDDDFIWLYSLLEPWDKDHNSHPAPVVKCRTDDTLPRENVWKGFLITVFTCFPAVWESA